MINKGLRNNYRVQSIYNSKTKNLGGQVQNEPTRFATSIKQLNFPQYTVQQDKKTLTFPQLKNLPIIINTYLEHHQKTMQQFPSQDPKEIASKLLKNYLERPRIKSKFKNLTNFKALGKQINIKVKTLSDRAQRSLTFQTTFQAPNHSPYNPSHSPNLVITYQDPSPQRQNPFRYRKTSGEKSIQTDRPLYVQQPKIQTFFTDDDKVSQNLEQETEDFQKYVQGVALLYKKNEHH